MKLSFVALVLVLLTLTQYVHSDSVTVVVKKAQLLACSCKLNSNAELKSFVDNEAKNFPYLEVKFNGGSPRISFLDDSEKEAELVDINLMKSTEVVELLKTKGLVYQPKQTQESATDDIGTLVK
eukprot:CAMPEP_0168344778 /NCGR_PEP_ID=MMETSP0213-20121227/17061_1 /TAXON_ID=151035 /ORGANISM="Euplotes harpa, Strain FSP1.4" /LENGTH=123 /DNA_ID=CAMNT_0008352669 /DNA_START=7 /DNA_END=378 /DNA_ORIENTATION=-